MKKYADAILRMICDSKDHMTAEQIFLKLKKEMPKVVLATVYNNLNRLYEQGRVRRLSVDGFPDRYDRIGRHDHLICRRCGKLTDICLNDLTDMFKEQLSEEIIAYDLRIEYICAECRAAHKSRGGLAGVFQARRTREAYKKKEE